MNRYCHDTIFKILCVDIDPEFKASDYSVVFSKILELFDYYFAEDYNDNSAFANGFTFKSEEHEVEFFLKYGHLTR